LKSGTFVVPVWEDFLLESAIPVFQPESPEAEAMYDLFIKVSLICGVIFVIVAGLIFVALLRNGSKITWWFTPAR
jgi:heme/copper-type cytochrome/quinol oxidase subunit 2